MKNTEIIDAILLRKNNEELYVFTDDEDNTILVLGNKSDFIEAENIEILNAGLLEGNNDYDYSSYYNNIKERLKLFGSDTDFIILN